MPEGHKQIWTVEEYRRLSDPHFMPESKTDGAAKGAK